MTPSSSPLGRKEEKDMDNDDCHCHNNCEECKKFPNTTCIHCHPEKHQPKEFQDLRDKLHEVVFEWDCWDDCGRDYYGHKGYFHGCHSEEDAEQKIDAILDIFKQLASPTQEANRKRYDKFT